MNLIRIKLITISLSLAWMGCSGMKVIHPEQSKDSGTMMLDWSNGTLKAVGTYTCSIVASNGKRVSALGKSQSEASQEALARCRDQTTVSFCLEKNLKCYKN